MKIHRHNLAMQWITRRRTNEVQGKADPFYTEFKNYQAALSDGFEGTMDDYTVQQFEQGGRAAYRGAGLVDHGPEGVRQGYDGAEATALKFFDKDVAEFGVDALNEAAQLLEGKNYSELEGDKYWNTKKKIRGELRTHGSVLGPEDSKKKS